MKMLRITKCTDPAMWYAALVGELVPYCGEWPDGYKSREPAGYSNIVKFEDAELLIVSGCETDLEVDVKPRPPYLWHLTKGDQMRKVILAAMCVLAVGCGSKSATDKVNETTSKVYALNADERSLAAINGKSYFEREWVQAGGSRGQFVNCRPSDSNFNGMVSCFGMMPQPNGTYKEMKMYCGYKPELVGCSDEDTVK